MTPETFAKLIRLTGEHRENSWDNAGRGKYILSWNQAADIACVELKVDARWATIVAVLMFPGYCDTYDWADRILGRQTERLYEALPQPEED